MLVMDTKVHFLQLTLGLLGSRWDQRSRGLSTLPLWVWDFTSRTSGFHQAYIHDLKVGNCLVEVRWVSLERHHSGTSVPSSAP